MAHNLRLVVNPLKSNLAFTKQEDSKGYCKRKVEQGSVLTFEHYRRYVADAGNEHLREIDAIT